MDDATAAWHLSQGKWHWRRRGRGWTWHRSQASWHYRRVPFAYLAQGTLQKYRVRLAENIVKSNPLLNRLAR
jgi:hypothetical protein